MSMVSYPHILGSHKLRETKETYLVKSQNNKSYKYRRQKIDKIYKVQCLKDYLAFKESKN